ncbi:hypothetical protein ACQPX6_19305 [Actinomycetospora sp. CA-101289]|uniref:hypothetical protein n=1 Tax=Actinomycetospora sp. CA-101289 TaxID=3239893 RepID=UPI003D95F713
MDIGPVRRRFTAEPVSSPVPGEKPSVHEPSAEERSGSAPGPTQRDAATSTGTLRAP